jgi:unsaturated rhamnogalacturonyl hydrolase
MKTINRRQAMSVLATIPFLPYSSALPLYGKDVSDRKIAGNVDWSKELCDSEMQRIPDPRRLRKWGYAISLYLYGQFLVYKRTGEKKYLDYIQGMGGRDAFFNSDVPLWFSFRSPNQRSLLTYLNT